MNISLHLLIVVLGKYLLLPVLLLQMLFCGLKGLSLSLKLVWLNGKSVFIKRDRVYDTFSIFHQPTLIRGLQFSQETRILWKDSKPKVKQTLPNFRLGRICPWNQNVVPHIFVSIRNYLADPPFSRFLSICQTSLLLRIPKAVSFVTQSGCYISTQQLDIGEHSVPSLVFTFGGMMP